MYSNNKLLDAVCKTEDYQLKANTFLEMTKTNMRIDYLKTGRHFDDDKESRDIYQITIERNGHIMKFNFGNSIADKEHWTVEGIFTNSGFVPSLKQFYRQAEAIQADIVKNGKKSKLKHHPRIEPTPYDVLSCLTKSDPGTFEQFCSDFGYDEDSRRAEKTYHAVVKEYEELSNIFNYSELEAMAEIQ